MPKANKKSMGHFGENLAVSFLQRKGYTILKRNFQTRQGEIDIIAVDKEDQLIFCEVKTRATDAFGSGEEAIGWQKEKKMRSTALGYLAIQSAERAENFRFDAISIRIVLKEKRAYLRHWLNIFEA